MTFEMATSLACDLFQQSKLQDCCGTINTLNDTGSGNADLYVVGFPEAFIESFRLLLDDAEIFCACIILVEQSYK